LGSLLGGPSYGAAPSLRGPLHGAFLASLVNSRSIGGSLLGGPSYGAAPSLRVGFACGEALGELLAWGLATSGVARSVPRFARALATLLASAGLNGP